MQSCSGFHQEADRTVRTETAGEFYLDAVRREVNSPGDLNSEVVTIQHQRQRLSQSAPSGRHFRVGHSVVESAQGT